MSGHSKWATIKHKKAAKDARRGAAFTKFANLIAVAARSGGDPATNFKLRLAVDKAKLAGVPNANIDRAIMKGTGEGGGAQVEEIIYEGYGPAGVAVLVETATDNRNRTAPEVRAAFNKHGGRMGETGSVAFQFEQKGIVRIKASDAEAATLAAIDAGAEDVDDSEPGLVTVYTAPTQLAAVQKQLEAAGYEAESAELAYEPKQVVQITDAKTASIVVRLMDALDELDDVTNTYANFDIPEEVLSAVD